MTSGSRSTSAQRTRSKPASSLLSEVAARWQSAAVRLGLSSPARELVELLLACDLDATTRSKLLGNDADRAAPRRAHVLAALSSGSEREVVGGLLEVERRGVVRTQEGTLGPWLAAEVMLDARVRDFCLAPDVASEERAQHPTGQLPTRLRHSLDRVVEFDSVGALVVVRGRRGSGRDTVLGHVLQTCGAAPLLRSVAELRGPLDSLEPELSGAAAVWDARGFDPSPEEYRTAAQWLSRSSTICVALLDPHQDAPEIPERALVELSVDPVDVAERRAMWASQLVARGCAANISESVGFELATRSRAGAGLAARALRATQLSGEPRELVRRIESHLATQIQPSATRGVTVERPGPETSLSRLVVAPPISRALQHTLVLARTAPYAADPTRRGVKALLSGPSGTGKTLAARAIAHDLELPLFRVDLAALVSKWLGETEKNLRHAFEAAESAGAVLLFDEGDALFGKRGEVDRGTDRYANLEVSYLLQALEAHDGVVIVTTNLKAQIDRAFMRRFDVAIEFHAPSRAERALLWRLELGGAGAELDEAFVTRELASIELTGGNIAAAARLARALATSRGDASISTDDARDAVQSELGKVGAGATAARWAARSNGAGAHR